MTDNATTRGNPIAVVMGVAGSGKSTVGPALAAHYGVQFRDADEFHPQSNIDKMAAGHALTDADREPWLDAIGAWLDAHRADGGIVTCSALKRSYRDRLRTHVPGLPFLHLDGPQQVAAERVGSRPGHFMPASLVADQYATLQPLQADEAGVVGDFTLPVAALVDEFASYLDTHPLPAAKEQS